MIEPPTRYMQTRIPEGWTLLFSYRDNFGARYDRILPYSIQQLLLKAIPHWHDENVTSDADVENVKHDLTSLWGVNLDVKGCSYNRGEYLILHDRSGNNYVARVREQETVEIFYIYSYMAVGENTDFDTMMFCASGASW